MIIPGYLDGYEPPFMQSPLIDGSELMANDLFWPALLYTVGGAMSAPKAFAADAADLSELIDQFLDPDQWPVFSMPLTGRSHLRVIMRNFPDESGVDYMLDPGRSDMAIPLAAMEGHFRGPALAWSELIATAKQPDNSLSAAKRLLLLLPACADANRPNSAVDVITAALTAVGARSHQRQVSSELLDTRRYWTPCPWTFVDDMLICLGAHAYRRPGGTLSPDDLRLITTALSAPDGA